MQLEVGTVIIDKTDDINDIGVIVNIEEDQGGAHIYSVHWTCKRSNGRNYTTPLSYPQEEMDCDAFGEFEVIG